MVHGLSSRVVFSAAGLAPPPLRLSGLPLPSPSQEAPLDELHDQHAQDADGEDDDRGARRNACEAPRRCRDEDEDQEWHEPSTEHDLLKNARLGEKMACQGRGT